VTFDIIELGPYIRKGLNLTDDDVIVNQNFKNLGYDSEYFIINFGTLLLVLGYLIIMLLFYACTSGKGTSRFVRCRNQVTKGLVWNSVLSFVSESYMLLSISSVVNTTKFQFEDLGTALSSNFTAVVLILLVVFPVFTLLFMYMKRRKLNKETFKSKYGAIYESLKTTRNKTSSFYEPLISMYRMLALTFVLIYLQEFRYFQLFFVNFSMTFILVYAGICEPYVDKTTSFFSQFNEVFVAITNYHLMCFADFVQDEWTRNIVGWSLIVSVGLNLLINISFIMAGAIRDSCRKIKFKYYTWKLNQAKRQKAQKEMEKAAQLQTAILVVDERPNELIKDEGLAEAPLKKQNSEI
jgi:hypothetical protein